MSYLVKYERVLKFYFGARIRPIFSQLAKGGFTEEHLTQGSKLLRQAAPLVRADARTPKDESNLIARFEEFERRWYRPVKAALGRAFPAMAEMFFEGLTIQTGREAAISVSLFLEKLDAMAQAAAPFGADGPKARELLAGRNLTNEVESEALALVDEWDSVTGQVESTLEVDEAIAQLWAWYLDWSGSARTLITSKADLRALGYGRTRSALEEEEEVDVEETPVANMPAIGPVVASPSLPATGGPTSPASPTEAPMAPPDAAE